MAYYQIGTAEPRGVVGSRAARSDNLADALNECREYSQSRSIKEAWLRLIEDSGSMSGVLATFVKGQRIDA